MRQRLAPLALSLLIAGSTSGVHKVARSVPRTTVTGTFSTAALPSSLIQEGYQALLGYFVSLSGI